MFWRWTEFYGFGTTWGWVINHRSLKGYWLRIFLKTSKNFVPACLINFNITPKDHVKTKKEIDNQAISTHIFGLWHSSIGLRATEQNCCLLTSSSNLKATDPYALLEYIKRARKLEKIVCQHRYIIGLYFPQCFVFFGLVILQDLSEPVFLSGPPNQTTTLRSHFSPPSPFIALSAGLCPPSGKP